MHIDLIYKDMIQHVLKTGEDRSDRTGTGTKGVFGYSFSYALSEGFPLLTTKYITFKGVFDELRWMYSGSTNVNDLAKHIQPWWRPFADEKGRLGQTYGANLRYFPYLGGIVDQLEELFKSLGENRTSRRHVMSTWNAGSVPRLSLPSCHGLVIQFYVYNDGRLSMQTYQRSADLFLGVPINIAHYALLLEMVAFSCGYTPYELKYTFGDLHIYKNHVDQCVHQIGLGHFEPPKLQISAEKWENPLDTFLNIGYNDLTIEGYKHHPKLKGEMSV